ncbi:MAG: response regulator transcription factor [Stellaceae bacterium]
MALILVIDDQEMVRITVKRILASAGHEVVEAASGDAGVALYLQRQPVLVLTDLLMPDKPGGETIAQLRENGATAKIIAMSGGDGLDLAREIGADEVLEKPFRADALLALVRTLIG